MIHIKKRSRRIPSFTQVKNDFRRFLSVDVRYWQYRRRRDDARKFSAEMLLVDRTTHGTLRIQDLVSFLGTNDYVTIVRFLFDIH